MANEVKNLMNDNHHPSSVDNMLNDDTPFEGTANSLPPSSTNPVPGADGKLSTSTIKKT